MGNQLYDTYLNLNVKNPNEGTALLNVHVGAGYKLRLDVAEPDDSEHSVNPEMIAHSEDEIDFSGYLMT